MAQRSAAATPIFCYIVDIGDGELVRMNAGRIGMTIGDPAGIGPVIVFMDHDHGRIPLEQPGFRMISYTGPAPAIEHTGFPLGKH